MTYLAIRRVAADQESRAEPSGAPARIRALPVASRLPHWLTVLTAACVLAVTAPEATPQVVLETGFESLDASAWVCKGADAVLRDGRLIIEPRRSQQYLMTRNPVLYGTLDVSFRLGCLSSDSTVFYYLGFHGITPWARDICWLQVQDSVVTVVLRKEGRDAFRKAIGHVEQGRSYRLRIVWRPASVRVLLDDRPVFTTDELRVGLSSASTASDVIPNRPLYVFLSANRIREQGQLPSLQLDAVRVAHTPILRRREREQSARETQLLSARERHDGPGGWTVTLEDGKIRCENERAVYRLDWADGLQWGRLFGKSTATECLAPDANLPLFAVLDGASVLDSRDFHLEDVRAAPSGDALGVRCLLSNEDAALQAELHGVVAAEDGIRMRLSLRHTVYIDHRFCWRETRTGKEFGSAWAAMYEPGKLAYYSRPGDQWVTSFYEQDEWAGYIADVCARLVRDTGMDGIYLDELGIAFPDYNPLKGPLREEGVPVSPRLLGACIRNVRDKMAAEKEEAVLMFEHASSDWLSQFVDGSWAQTFYTGAFAFAEEHYDDNSLLYFRFCFPELKLAEWGESADGPRRCLFNGVGIDWNNISQPWNREGRDYILRSGQAFRECGDAFATTRPEPHVPTLVPRLFANRFTSPSKAVWTLYNKTGASVAGEAIVVRAPKDVHYVELLGDTPVRSERLPDGCDRLLLECPADAVLCVAQLPRAMSSERRGDGVVVRLGAEPGAGLVLRAYTDRDDSHLHASTGREVEVRDGVGVLPAGLVASAGEGKVILKLSRGPYLVDEVVLGPGWAK